MAEASRCLALFSADLYSDLHQTFLSSELLALSSSMSCLISEYEVDTRDFMAADFGLMLLLMVYEASTTESRVPAVCSINLSACLRLQKLLMTTSIFSTSSCQEVSVICIAFALSRVSSL